MKNLLRSARAENKAADINIRTDVCAWRKVDGVREKQIHLPPFVDECVFTLAKHEKKEHFVYRYCSGKLFLFIRCS